MAPQIVMMCSLDTKGGEADYLRSCLEDLGAAVTVIDVGYGGPATTEATVSAAAIAAAAGTDIEVVRTMAGTGERSQTMMNGARVIVQELIAAGRCDAVIAFGGASNTTLATGVMRALPIGLPKLMISTAAAIPAYAARYFGAADITMMHAVADFSGLNPLTRSILQQGARAICGMAAVGNGPAPPQQQGPAVAVTSFRFAEKCSRAVVTDLERRGYSPITFHAQGIGGTAMEHLLAEGRFAGVVDIVPAGVGERLLGGNRAAGPERLEGAGRAGIPQVLAPGGFDMISCGPIARRDSGDPLWEQLGLASRRYSIPDDFRVEARTTPKEVAAIAREVARKLNAGTGEARVLVPLRGWSSLSTVGAELHDPEADAAFVPALRRALTRDVAVVEIDTELNSTEFAGALVDAIEAMLP